jgi:hypothetical protein
MRENIRELYENESETLPGEWRRCPEAVMKDIPLVALPPGDCIVPGASVTVGWVRATVITRIAIAGENAAREYAGQSSRGFSRIYLMHLRVMLLALTAWLKRLESAVIRLEDGLERGGWTRSLSETTPDLDSGDSEPTSYCDTCMLPSHDGEYRG